MDWFNLSYALFLVILIVLILEMPTEQQVKIVASLHEHDEMFDTSSAVNSASTVCIYKDNKINKIPNYILNYLRSDCNEN